MVLARDIVSVLSGAWTLLNTTTTRNGTPVGQPDTDEVGQIIYHPYGYMSADIMTEPVPTRDPSTDAEYAKIGRGLVTYAGPFSFVPDTPTSGLMTHGPLTMANIPSWVGSHQLRNFTLMEEGAILRLSIFNASTTNTQNLHWGRLKEYNTTGT